MQSGLFEVKCIAIQGIRIFSRRDRKIKYNLALEIPVCKSGNIVLDACKENQRWKTIEHQIINENQAGFI